MAFEGLSERLQAVLGKLRGKGKVTEADVKAAMREVRLALLEADVNFKVVKEFIDRVRERAVGQEVLKSLTPGQQVIKVVNEELTRLMGGEQSKLTFSPSPPTVIMMVGLQGAGKTTTAGKLALHLKNRTAAPCWWPETSTVRPPSASWKCWGSRSTCRFSPWATRKAPSASPRKA